MNLTSSMEKCLSITYPYVCALIMFLACMTTSVLITCLCSCFCSANYKKMKNRVRHRLILAQDSTHNHHHHHHHGDQDDEDLLPFSLQYASNRGHHHGNRHAPASSQPSTLTLNSDSGHGSSSSGANYFFVSPSRLDSNAFFFGGANNNANNSPSQFSQPPSPSLLSTDSGHVAGHFRTFSTSPMTTLSMNPAGDTVLSAQAQLTQVSEGEQAPPPPYENFQPPTYAETILHYNNSQRK